ncbi:MAG: hypothetical protein NVS1B1_02830 [Candidatus Limnocylindrales bacterium]
MKISVRRSWAVRFAVGGIAALALAGCAGTGTGGSASATSSAVAPAAATAKPTLAPRPSGSPPEGYKDDYGY